MTLISEKSYKTSISLLSMKILKSLVIPSFLLVLFCCQENVINSTNINDIENARNWFEKNKTHLSENSSSSNFGKINANTPKIPDWNKSKVHSLKNGLKMVEVNLSYDTYLLFSDSEQRMPSSNQVLNSMLLIEVRSDQYEVFLLKFYPEKENFTLSTKDFENINFGKIPSNFSGSMMIFDWNEKFIGGWKIMSGEKGFFYSKHSAESSEDKIGERSASTAAWDCYIITTYWYSQACTRGGECSEPVLIDITMTQVCEYILAPGDGSGSGGPGDPTANTCFIEHPFIQGLMVPCEELPTITNYVTNPCIHQQVNKAITANMTNEINTLVQDIFSINDLVNLELSQVDYLDAEESAITTAYKQGDVLNVEIFFNENTLPTRSQEYIMATVYHEFLHAIMYSNYISPSQQHTDMASQYVNILSAALLQHFPSLTANEANELSWGGLQETDAWNNLSVSKRNSIISTNVAHQSGQAGQDCD